MAYIITIAVALIAISIAVRLYQFFLARRVQRRQRLEVAYALDLSEDSETPWVNILVKARKEMPPEKYEKFEAAVFDLVAKVNQVSSDNAKSQSEKMALLARLFDSHGLKDENK